MARPGDIIENPVIGDRIVFRRTRDETDGELLEFELYAQPSASGPPRHVHRHSEERFEVIQGQLRVEVGDQVMSFGEGEAFTVAPGVAHTWWNDGETEARVQVRLQPEAGMEAFLETMYGLAKDGKTNAQGLPNLLQLAVTASAYRDASYVTTPPLIVQKLLFAVLAPIARRLGYRAEYPYPYGKDSAEAS